MPPRKASRSAEKVRSEREEKVGVPAFLVKNVLFQVEQTCARGGELYINHLFINVEGGKVNMSVEVDLKPCPFCGGIAELSEETVCFGHGEFITKHYVVCDSCHAQTKSFPEYYEKDPIGLAVDAWNKRSNDNINK